MGRPPRRSSQRASGQPCTECDDNFDRGERLGWCGPRPKLGCADRGQNLRARPRPKLGRCRRRRVQKSARLERPRHAAPARATAACAARRIGIRSNPSLDRARPRGARSAEGRLNASRHRTPWAAQRFGSTPPRRLDKFAEPTCRTTEPSAPAGRASRARARACRPPVGARRRAMGSGFGALAHIARR